MSQQNVTYTNFISLLFNYKGIAYNVVPQKKGHKVVSSVNQRSAEFTSAYYEDSTSSTTDKQILVDCGATMFEDVKICSFVGYDAIFEIYNMSKKCIEYYLKRKEKGIARMRFGMLEVDPNGKTVKFRSDMSYDLFFIIEEWNVEKVGKERQTVTRIKGRCVVTYLMLSLLSKVPLPLPPASGLPSNWVADVLKAVMKKVLPTTSVVYSCGVLPIETLVALAYTEKYYGMALYKTLEQSLDGTNKYGMEVFWHSNVVTFQSAEIVDYPSSGSPGHIKAVQSPSIQAPKYHLTDAVEVQSSPDGFQVSSFNPTTITSTKDFGGLMTLGKYVKIYYSNGDAEVGRVWSVNRSVKYAAARPDLSYMITIVTLHKIDEWLHPIYGSPASPKNIFTTARELVDEKARNSPDVEFMEVKADATTNRKVTLVQQADFAEETKNYNVSSRQESAEVKYTVAKELQLATLPDRLSLSLFAGPNFGVVYPLYGGMKAAVFHNHGKIFDAQPGLYGWHKLYGSNYGIPAHNPGDYLVAVPTSGKGTTRAGDFLIDKDGNTVIRGKKFTVSVGQAVASNSRPAAEADTVTIKTDKGAEITIDAAGNINIKGTATVVVDATQVKLGGAGASLGVARISSSCTSPCVPGKPVDIILGSTKVKTV